MSWIKVIAEGCLFASLALLISSAGAAYDRSDLLTQYADQQTRATCSYDEAKPVVELFRNNDKQVLNIGFSDSFGKLETLGVTPEHPFWVEGKGWTNAGDLAIDDQISTLENGVVKVASIASDAKKHTTYNFEVEGFHTYFVGESALWVHNVCPDDPKGLKDKLPQIDRTGKLHGDVPHIKDLKSLDKGTLTDLRDDLKSSLKRRKQVTKELGPDAGHSRREAAEEDLLKSLDKLLGD